MLRINPALAIVFGGVLSGALVAQAVPTDPNGVVPRPWAQTAVEDYPEITGITYETLPGAASDPYNFTHHVSALRHATIDDHAFDDLPASHEADYADDLQPYRPDPQLLEDEEIIPVDGDEVVPLDTEEPAKPAIVLSIG